MEDDKKKKKNKKKKNKQQTNKAAESASTDVVDDVQQNKIAVAGRAAESASVDVVHDAQASNGQVGETTDVATDVVQNAETHLHRGAQGLTEAEKQHWLDREAAFEEKIKQLQKEKDEQKEKEAAFEEKIKQLQKEKDEQKEKEAILKEKMEHLLKEKHTILQKVASLEEKLQQLQNEKDANEEKNATSEDKIVYLQKEREAQMHKEASLEEKVAQLQKEKDSLMQKEAELEMKIMHLEGEKQSWLQKEAVFEEKINRLMDEGAALGVKGVNLEEKIKQMERERDSLVQNENTIKETVASLDHDNTKLRAEVMELGELRNSLLQENHLLKEKISDLESHIQNLENSAPIPISTSGGQMATSANGEVNSDTDAARMLVEKLIAENAELVEKVNELYVELSRRGPTIEASLSMNSQTESVTAESAHVSESSQPESNIMVEAAAKSHGTEIVADPMLESSKTIPSPGDRTQSLEEVAVKDERSTRDYFNADDSIVLSNSSEIIESDEIVQIPLDENEVEVNNNLEPPYNDEENTEVALTEAPLIGAPFRLISFVARYVSGADLVNK